MWAQRQIKWRQHCKWSLPRSHISLRKRFWKSSVSSDGSLSAAFHCGCELLIFQATMDLESGVGTGQVKMPQHLLFLLISSHISWINTPQIAASLWLLSRVLTKFYQVHISFMAERIFRGVTQQFSLISSL